MELNEPSSTATEELCLVCNDTSTGYHYGTPSCNGCKTFFRRTITKNQSFVCQYNGSCLIDKSIRCACRHCRFKKCLAVGMRKDAIQQNRDPIGYTKRTRRYPPISAPKSASSAGTSDSGPLDELTTPNQPVETKMFDELCRVEKYIKLLRHTDYVIHKSLVTSVMMPSILLNQTFLETLESKIPEAEVLRPANPSDYQLWHEKDWSIMIEWAKTLDTYNKLDFNDKCFYTPNKGPDTVVFPNGAYFDRTPEPNRPAGFQRKKYKMLDNLLKPMRKMDIDINEFAAAKAIFFLNPDADDLTSPEVRMTVSEARSAYTNALYRYMVKKCGAESAADRFGQLLLLGPAIATMAVEMREAVVVADFFEQIYFSPFAKELLLGVFNNSLDLQNMQNVAATATSLPNVVMLPWCENSTGTASLLNNGTLQNALGKS